MEILHPSRDFTQHAQWLAANKPLIHKGRFGIFFCYSLNGRDVGMGYTAKAAYDAWWRNLVIGSPTR